MLRIQKRRSKYLVTDVNSVFNTLLWRDVSPYLNDLLRYKAFTSLMCVPADDVPVGLIPCKTDFGVCTLAQISMSIKVLILCKIKIKNNENFCFPAGLIGDNYLQELVNICENSDLIRLYSTSNLLPQVCSAATKIERCSRNG
jgi:hypothetical protein